MRGRCVVLQLGHWDVLCRNISVVIRRGDDGVINLVGIGVFNLTASGGFVVFGAFCSENDVVDIVFRVTGVVPMVFFKLGAAVKNLFFVLNDFFSVTTLVL